MSKLSSRTLWYVCKENTRYTVRKTVTDSDGTKHQVRLDRDLYRAIEKDKAEITAFVVRLNAKENPGQKVRELQITENAFISVALIEKFEAHLKESIPSENYVSGIMGRVRNHFLRFFMNDLKLNDPNEWHRVHKEKWSKYLNAANRFIDWLSERRPDVPKLVFEPISKAKFSTLKAEHDADETNIKPCMIEDSDWKRIKQSLPEDIAPFIHLGYAYGLRRAEILGLELKDIRVNHLSVERQLSELERDSTGAVTDKKTRILKGKTMRKVPHWTCKPDLAYQWIESAIEFRIMPDTLTQKWSDYMRTLKLTYTLHDMRHTWVTKMLRDHLPRDVQLAAGHKNIETTMGYAHDDRDLDEQVFKPKKAG
jgi:integrase